MCISLSCLPAWKRRTNRWEIVSWVNKSNRWPTGAKYRFLQKVVRNKRTRSLEKKVVAIIRRDNSFFFFNSHLRFIFFVFRGFIENISYFINIANSPKYERKYERSLETVVNLKENGTLRTIH